MFSFIFEINVLNIVSFVLFSLIAIVIWDVIVLPLLMEKIFSLILVFCLLAFWMLLNGLEFLPLVILLLYVGAIAVLFLFVVMILNPDFVSLLKQKQDLVGVLSQRQQALTLALQGSLDNNLNSEVYQKIDQALNNKSVMITNVTKGGYFSTFFLGFLLGSFFGGLLSWYTYLTFKFNLPVWEALHLQQLFGVGAMEPAIIAAGMHNVDISPVSLQLYYNPAWFEQTEVINIGLLLYTKYGIALLIIGLMLLVSMMGAIILTLRQTTFIKRQVVGLQSVRYTS